MSSKKLSRDQKRKTKLAERDKKYRAMEIFQPYPGRKYQADQWTPVLFATETAIHDTILESNRTLTNAQVRQALVLLIDHLRRGGPVAPTADEPEVPCSPASVVERLFFNIRLAWSTLADSGRAVAAADLIGVLRTLLGSMEAQAMRLGASRGYVAFLEEFMPKAQATREASAIDLINLYESTQAGVDTSEDDDSEQED